MDEGGNRNVDDFGAGFSFSISAYPGAFHLPEHALFLERCLTGNDTNNEAPNLPSIPSYQYTDSYLKTYLSSQTNDRNASSQTAEEQHTERDTELPGKKRRQCPHCLNWYPSRHYSAHVNIHNKNRDKFGCSACGTRITRRFDMKKHIERNHSIEATPPSILYVCGFCNESFSERAHRDSHKAMQHT